MLRNTVLPLLFGVLLATAARGQGFGPDPFQPYNSQYAPFITPVAPGPMDYGYNNGLARGVRGANQFANYLDSLQTSAAGARAGGTGVGTPYYQANRAYDREFGRIYQPNKVADQQFETSQASVNQLYFEYLREKDPKKRAEIFRNYNRARSRADRELVSPRGVPGAQPGTRSTRREGRAIRSEDATEATDRDLLAPPPPAASDTMRSRARTARSGADSSLGPPPSPLRGSRSRIWEGVLPPPEPGKAREPPSGEGGGPRDESTPERADRARERVASEAAGGGGA
ncbi:MAG: hypothetical protein JO344_12480, partial [Planctomycetaceae bacterium]|nr:hypothetical protein [Planctomycetaceae bacterium]